MLRRETSLTSLGARVRRGHLDVASAADWERARQRFEAIANSSPSSALERLSLARLSRGRLLLAAALATTIAGAAVVSNWKQTPTAPVPARPSAAAVSGASHAPGLAGPSVTVAPEAPPSSPASVPVHRKLLAAPADSADVPLSALPPWVQRDRLLAERRVAAGSLAASSAAFRLGRVEADYLGHPNEAAKWFATYLAEQPQGPLRGDALGRLFECLWQSGQRAAAEAQAERYLLEYPGGPHALRARRILNR